MARIGIIGAGASGVYCAIMLLQRLKRFNKQAEVELIEQNSLIARRLLVSGNGRCNLLPSFLSMDGFFGASKKVIEVFLKALPQKNQEDFFNDLGILLKTEADGRIFPCANDAKSVC